MLDIDKLKGKEETLKISDQELKIMPLTFNELTEFMKYAEKNKTQEGAMYLMKVALRQNMPENTDEKTLEKMAKEISSENGIEILNKIKEISGLSDSPNSLPANDQ